MILNLWQILPFVFWFRVLLNLIILKWSWNSLPHIKIVLILQMISNMIVSSMVHVYVFSIINKWWDPIPKNGSGWVVINQLEPYWSYESSSTGRICITIRGSPGSEHQRTVNQFIDKYKKYIINDERSKKDSEYANGTVFHLATRDRIELWNNLSRKILL